MSCPSDDRDRTDKPVFAQDLVIPAWNKVYQTVPGQWHFSYTGLWNESLPYYKDPLQGGYCEQDAVPALTAVAVNDCWMPAALAAIAWVCPDWLSHLFFYPDNTPMRGMWYPASEWAQVQLWNPSTGWPQNFTVNVYNQSISEDRPGQMWWPSAIEQGFSQMAQVTDVFGYYSNGTQMWNKGIPSVAMAMILGKYVANPVVNNGGQVEMEFDDFWEIVQHGDKSPIVVNTLGDGATANGIKSNHAFAVLQTGKFDNGTQKITVRNTWGTNDNFQAKLMWKSTWLINYIPDFPTPTWGE